MFYNKSADSCCSRHIFQSIANNCVWRRSPGAKSPSCYFHQLCSSFYVINHRFVVSRAIHAPLPIIYMTYSLNNADSTVHSAHLHTLCILAKMKPSSPRSLVSTSILGAWALPEGLFKTLTLSRKSNGNIQLVGGATTQKWEWKSGFGADRSSGYELCTRPANVTISFWCVLGWGAVLNVIAITTSGGVGVWQPSDNFTLSGPFTMASNRHQLIGWFDTWKKKQKCARYRQWESTSQNEPQKTN